MSDPTRKDAVLPVAVNSVRVSAVALQLALLGALWFVTGCGVAAVLLSRSVTPGIGTVVFAAMAVGGSVPFFAGFARRLSVLARLAELSDGAPRVPTAGQLRDAFLLYLLSVPGNALLVGVAWAICSSAHVHAFDRPALVASFVGGAIASIGLGMLAGAFRVRRVSQRDGYLLMWRFQFGRRQRLEGVSPFVKLGLNLASSSGITPPP